MWKITDLQRQNQETEVGDLIKEYPKLVAYDNTGFVVDLDNVRDPGVYQKHFSDRKIYFWKNEEESVNDDGSSAVAVANWVA